MSDARNQAGAQLGKILAMEDAGTRDKLLLDLLARQASSLTTAAIQTIRVVWLGDLAALAVQQGAADSKQAANTGAASDIASRLFTLYATLRGMLAKVGADDRRALVEDELSALQDCDALPAEALQALSKQLNSMA